MTQFTVRETTIEQQTNPGAIGKAVSDYLTFEEASKKVEEMAKAGRSVYLSGIQTLEETLATNKATYDKDGILFSAKTHLECIDSVYNRQTHSLEEISLSFKIGDTVTDMSGEQSQVIGFTHNGKDIISIPCDDESVLYQLQSATSCRLV